jgi:hypothetical protein
MERGLEGWGTWQLARERLNIVKTSHLGSTQGVGTRYRLKRAPEAVQKHVEELESYVFRKSSTSYGAVSSLIGRNDH